MKYALIPAFGYLQTNKNKICAALKNKRARTPVFIIPQKPCISTGFSKKVYKNSVLFAVLRKPACRTKNTAQNLCGVLAVFCNFCVKGYSCGSTS
jgi:hypothetical protein